MNEQQATFFNAICKVREIGAKSFDEPFMHGLIDSVVDKYTDQAHFIYELLQNADDAKATTARFILSSEDLIFAHNGSRHFSVSDPAKEAEDSANGRLGDINAITSIGNSIKNEAQIGKFGVGFKAVFQYTKTPYIYDPVFRFKIDKLIAPHALKDDHSQRRADETLFVFPFNHPARQPQEAYEDVDAKLNNLTFPLLFLSHLQKIEFQHDAKRGSYTKDIVRTIVYGDTIAEHIRLTQPNSGESVDELWLFSRTDENGRRYSVGFFLDAQGHLKPIRRPAFCFFPTKEDTHLNFILHAPFLLTDSREGIKAGNSYNRDLIQKLAVLAADSLEHLRDIGLESSTCLIDDNIVNIIPVSRIHFHPYDRDRVSFLPFYDEIKKRFQKAKLIPSADGYVTSEHAYWAEYPAYTELFSNKQLADIVDDPDAQWAFTSRGRNALRNSSSDLFLFIEDLVKANLDDDTILKGRVRENAYSIKGITETFIETQSIEWLHKFYKWLSASKERSNFAKNHPLFLDQNRKAVAALDKKGQLALFLPTEDENGYSVVHPDLLSDPDTKIFLTQTIGIKEPELKDLIYAKILKRYEAGEPSNIDADFRQFLKYYCQCSKQECTNFIADIKEYKFLRSECNGTESIGKASDMYIPNEDLRAYFETKPNTQFIILEKYKQMVDNEYKDKLLNFLLDLGVKKAISVDSRKITYDEYCNDPKFRETHRLPHTTKNNRSKIFWDEKEIDGCHEIIEYIIKYKDPRKSVILWKTLAKIIESHVYNSYSSYSSNWFSLEGILTGVLHYFYGSSRYESFPSSIIRLLRESAWLQDKTGAFVPPNELYLEDLAEAYDVSSEYASLLLEFLGVKEKSVEEVPEQDDSNLTDEQREKIDIAELLRAAGIKSKEEIQELLDLKRQKEAEEEAERLEAERAAARLADALNSGDCAPNAASEEVDEQEDDEQAPVERRQGSEPRSSRSASSKSSASGSRDRASSRRDDDNDDNDEDDDALDDILNTEDDADTEDSTQPQPRERMRRRQTTRNVVRDIYNRTKSKSDNKSDPSAFNDDEEEDEDERTPALVDYNKKIERAKRKSAEEICRIAHYEELQSRACELDRENKYSYAWFTTLLEMESVNSGEANADKKEVKISFGKVEREPNTKRTLVLKHPNNYIPQFMEDLANIPLTLHMSDKTKSIEIEVASVRSYTLRVKVKDAATLDGLDLNAVQEATIVVTSPAFLLEELRKCFDELNYDADYNMKSNLCENIEFVFGPPGTGKTTHLARNVLIPLMKSSEACRVLVLTPTNKSADVLVKRIMETSDDDSYNDWLVRFGSTADEDIEQSPVYKEKDFDIRKPSKSVTVTTIARFPYDFFMARDESGFLPKRLYLRDLDWDYIVIDEASMIPIANIVYPLYQKRPRKFIIAGDPFQIEPITSVDLWKDENIYKMVELDSFATPTTQPRAYKVETLTTQYRSVPAIGEIFSKFAYDGILKHHRQPQTQRPLNLGNELKVKTLNVVKFPVSKYESIYRAKRLQKKSSYQIYSALFTFEYAAHLARAIAKNNPGQEFKIGIIAPYRAQADLIDKLLASEKIPPEVDIQAGTIHGFQGDECDIIFAVFNTPPTISNSKQMFLNKRNIVNVSISRARDYLFVVMPDDKTEDIGNLRLVNRVRSLMFGEQDYQELLTPDLEQLMFGDPKFLENNSFSTSHQSVNVYGLPEKRYEVRAEDNAVDVQIHREAKLATSEPETPEPSAPPAPATSITPTSNESEQPEPTITWADLSIFGVNT